MCVISILAPTTKPVCVHGTPNTLRQHIGRIIYVKQPRHHPTSSSFIHWFLLLQKVKVKNNISTLKLTKTNKWDCFNKQTTNRAHQFSSHETPEIPPSSGPLTQKLVRFDCNIHVGILMPQTVSQQGKAEVLALTQGWVAALSGGLHEWGLSVKAKLLIGRQSTLLSWPRALGSDRRQGPRKRAFWLVRASP